MLVSARRELRENVTSTALLAFSFSFSGLFYRFFYIEDLKRFCSRTVTFIRIRQYSTQQFRNQRSIIDIDTLHLV